MLEHERSQLMRMVSPFDGYVEEPGRVSSTCLVTAARNHYSVPCELAGKMISKRLYPERIEVVFDEAVVASHPRLFERGQTRYDWQHYLPLVERKPGVMRNGAPFAQMPELLRRRRLQRMQSRRFPCTDEVPVARGVLLGSTADGCGGIFSGPPGGAATRPRQLLRPGAALGSATLPVSSRPVRYVPLQAFSIPRF
jgi:hypothetical protein